MMKTLMQTILFGCLAVWMSGCGQKQDEGALRIWCHQGQEAENHAMRQMVEAFNLAHADQGVRATIDFFPDYQYTERLAIAAAAGDMPDVFDLDGPTVAQFVDAGVLAPLSGLFADEELADFLPTILEQGTVDGKLYALGAFDSAMVLYYDRAMFEAADVAVPADGTAWTWAEFVDACRQLQAAGYEPVSLHMDVTADEWYTYAFSPLIWSAGGTLIDLTENRVEGVLNSAVNVAVLRDWQELFEEGFASRSPIQPDPFGAGDTAMDWSGHWMARSHIENKGERLGVMPLPRTGPEPAAACGSWCWAMAASTDRPELAALWLRWVTDPNHGIQPIVAAGGAVPARFSAFEHFPEYEADPFRLFRNLLSEHGRPRPQTPQYATLTQQFAAALRDIAGGADVEQRLGQAAAAVQRILDR